MRRIQQPMSTCVTKWRSRKGFTLIELLVVMGIAALLMTLAATSFFGASRRDNLTKSRNQFCDVLRLARQQACILGKTHVVVCWNAKTKIMVGDKEVDGGKQGRYALFEYVGNIWPDGRKLGAPFGIQREAFATLTKNARLININEPDKKFMRVEKVRHDATQSTEDWGRDEEVIDRIDLEYYVGGDKETMTVQGSSANNLWVATLRESAGGGKKPFPLGIRTTQTYSLPKDYAFDIGERAVFIFTADGQLKSGSATSIRATHSVAKNSPSFSVSVSSQGEVEPAQM